MVGFKKNQITNLPSNIIGISRVNSASELAQIYTAADVYLNLTYEDTYPSTNLEAQACGTPCVTYQTGGKCRVRTSRKRNKSWGCGWSIGKNLYYMQ